MKLLLDENISPSLVPLLGSQSLQADHVETLRLRGAADVEIWDYAKHHGYVIASKDSDFRQLSSLFGHPPKVIWLAVGNAATRAIATLLIDNLAQLQAFHDDAEASMLVLRPR
ncbi:MAG: DUF5615 family PIN-like protein [Myxococcales bacterium]|nr:DUF5615 family PIN-like protein [Myxococcales bacterium]